MALNRTISNIGLITESYGPPHNLGKVIDKSYELTVSSRIWGLDNEGNPNSFKVKANVAVMGSWVFMDVGECLHPLHALTQPKNTPEEVRQYQVGDSWYEYPWATTEGVWNPAFCDAYPDRIYFEESLPQEVLQVGGVASQHTVPIQEYTYSLDYLFEDKWYVNPGTQDTTGKLVISNTGEMEIWGNFDWEVTKATKVLKDGKVQTEFENEMIMTHGFNTHWPSKDYSKPGKKQGVEDYYVGFHSFSLVFKLTTSSYANVINEGYLDYTKVPVVTNGNRVLQNGVDLDKIDDHLAETPVTEGINKDDKEMEAYRKLLKYRRVRAYIYRTVDELKKVYSTADNKSELKKLLKELYDRHSTEAAGIISSSDMSSSASSGGSSSTGDDDTKMTIDE